MSNEAPGRGHVLLSLALVILVGAVVICSVAVATNGKKTSTISVVGTATLFGKPDTASFQIGVSTVAPSAKTALANNNTQVSAVETSLRAHGVTDSEMQTSGLDMYANTNQQGTITGFTADDSLTVTLHKLTTLGSVIDGAANAAGNGVTLGGITFSITNDAKILERARAAAVDNALVDATQIADAAGTKVNGVVKIVDQENQNTGVVMPFSNALAASSASVPVQPGASTVSVQVSVVYSLKK
jgi:uncharacterized protein YggE